MTGLIVIDESGDLGSGGSKYFAMAVTEVMSRRPPISLSKKIPRQCECRLYVSYPGIKAYC